MGDSKYFTTTSKGEMAELKRDLDSLKDATKKDAVKKVIAAMTLGKDVSVLFPDVVKCIRTPNLELKKLVYLYIMNYAKTQPEMAILSVNAFVQDAQHPNPLIRALAVRTMGCIRVDKITEYLCHPLRACLKDTDPYVRKTAAVCVAKLWDLDQDLVVEQGFLESLQDLLTDSNPMVVANAVAALSEIEQTSKDPVFEINRDNLRKLLAALNDCTEWGQVFILQALSDYEPADSREAESIAERVAPRLAHANSAVVLSTIRVLIKLLDFIKSDHVGALCKKMAPPLVTLLSKQPEIQYVALRNINLIVQKRPEILQYEMRVFFCKYNDPIYVKMEKLEVMIMLVTERTIEQVLMELKEYATEVDVEFVRKAVRAIGRCAIKLPPAAEKCVRTLLALIKTKVNYVVQEAVIVIKDIFRKYPNKYESIIAMLCENLDTLDEPEAKASMVWIIGEYADRIENADELLESFLDTFMDETPIVQLQLITAVVKLFLKKPKGTQEMVQRALTLATIESTNPDLRDRGFIYWRLLNKDPRTAKQVVLSERPPISEDSSRLDEALLDELISNLSTLSSVYHKPADSFSAVKATKRKSERKSASSTKKKGSSRADPTLVSSSSGGGEASLIDIGGLSLGEPSPVVDEASALSSALSGPPGPVLLDAGKGKGLEISAGFSGTSSAINFNLRLVNRSSSPMNGFMIQFDKNTFKLKPSSPIVNVPGGQLMPGQTADVSLPITFGGEPGTSLSTEIRVAMKNNVDVFYFAAQFPFQILFSSNGELSKGDYLKLWRSIPDANEHVIEVSPLRISDPASLASFLRENNIFMVARNQRDGNDVLYLSLRVEPPGQVLLVELTLLGGSCKAATRTQVPALTGLFEGALTSLLC